MLYQKISEINLDLEGRVAIKLHMGEKGNKTHISPDDVKIVFDKLKDYGCDPFLVDTTCLYEGPRSTPEGYFKVARENGFGNFPVVIARDEDYVVKGGFKIAKAVLDADSLLVLTHGKGHAITGYGGAIKNLGMGCVNKESKNHIHSPSKPLAEPSNCRKCKACERVCPTGAVKVKESGVNLEEKKCVGCEYCVESCPSGALKSRPGGLEKSFRFFSQAAKNVIDSFQKGNVAYITVLKNITEFCDCRSNSGKIVCPDIGYLSGKTALEIDQEAVKLIRQKNPKALNFRRWEIFEKEAKKVFGQ
ncbi:MAG: DUF362 domain-containing protein [Candidatus Aenigmatarchaeota archaeon]